MLFVDGNADATILCSTNEPAAKKVKLLDWQMFFDLQCPYSKKLWGMVPELRKKFGSDYDITTHITSLAFHRQSFPAHCAAYLIGTEKGGEARHQFESACYANIDRYVDEAAEKMNHAELNAVFATIAEEEDLFDDDEFTREAFLKALSDRKKVIMPTWFEHTEALFEGVYKAPQHVINGKLVPDMDSSWGIEEYQAALKMFK